MTDDMNKFDLTKREPLDDPIDAALAKYAAEPRAGLEERLLAHLRAQRKGSPSMAWWPWAGVAAAAILIATFLLWKLEPPRHERIVRRQPTLQQGTQPQIAAHPALPKIGQPAAPVSVRRSRRHIARETPVRSSEPNVTRRHESVRLAATRVAQPREVGAANPKLDQFPSPQPLSAEEIALVEYVRNFPEEAQLVAQAQEEFAIETEKEMIDAGSETRRSGSIEQER
jgi:hypothetical protein